MRGGFCAGCKLRRTGTDTDTSKGTGTGKALKKFFDSYEKLKSDNIKAGYITMSEQNPASGIYFADSKKKFEQIYKN